MEARGATGRLRFSLGAQAFPLSVFVPAFGGTLRIVPYKHP